MLISNIQRFSLHDGPGIRTTVFLKGCSVRCPWCANPENLSPYIEFYLDRRKCIGHNGGCFLNQNCKILKSNFSPQDLSDSQKCPINAIDSYGIHLEDDELLRAVLKDKNFYGKYGGVTFSGGEALLYMHELAPVITELRYRGINICVESSLFVDKENINLALKLVDHFIIDIKILNKVECHKIIGGNLDLYLENLDLVFREKKDVTFRFPVVPGITDTPENMLLIHDLLSIYFPNKLEIFSVHNLAEHKYHSLGRRYTPFNVAPFEHLNNLKMYLSESCPNIEICKL